MAIRITGMYSGLDTESIINELASAQSYKKNKLVKEQTKLSWKQDAWKALNTKIYSFYTNTLSNMRFQGSYLKKTTKVSNTNAINVTAGENAVNGTQTVKVEKLAKTGYLTGADLTTADGVCFTGGASLKQLGFSGEGSFDVKVGNKSTTINVSESTTINDVVSQLQSAGLNASYDQDNQRLFVSSKTTGADANFSLTGNNSKGMDALAALGLLSTNDLASDEYKTWAGYATDATAFDKAVEAEVAKRAAAYKTANDALQVEIDQLKADPGYVADKTAAELYEEVYGPEITRQKTDEAGDPVYDDQGDPVMETVREGGLQKEVDDAKTALDNAQKALDELKENGASDDEIAEAQQKVDDANTALTEKQSAFNETLGKYSIVKAVEDREEQIGENAKYYTVDVDDNVSGTGDLESAVRTEFQAKVDNAVEVIKNGAYASKAKGTKVDGRDAEIMLNGAKFTSASNTFSVNGLTITAQEETANDVTITTTEDSDGIYDMIKNFFSEYNKLINEMDSLYNAESSKGYDPLTSEEKKELSDTEVEEWEKKIKDSILRKDSTLSSVSSAMSTALMQGFTVNGKTMYLSDFGINTLGYFKSAENEKHAYHINGDKDDSNVSGETNTLKQMIASDPETVMQFFSSMSTALYDTLTDKMSTSTMSSAFTVYNDKQMKSDYKDYTEKISKQEEKLNDLIDKWYSKFSAMETALAKLESKNNAVSGMFGN
ncbi:MAG: flagellar filament capping protein FliD [Lachnospiraceae bacterium]|nr:flagellar filament capping protein FliD [Lachnospiraceae bacterium]